MTPARVVLAAAVCGTIGLAAAAAARPPRPDPPPWSGLGAGRTLGEAVWSENLTVWPVLAPGAPRDTEFTTLRAALDAREASVREQDEGEVNRVRVENRGRRPMLILAGTILKGGNQDRQVGRDVVIGAGRTASVDAFCVEHSRWTAEREGRNTAGLFEVPEALATKRVRAVGQHVKDQGEVWNQVASVNERAGRAPGTGTHLAALEAALGSGQRFREGLEATIGRGIANSGVPVVGFAYAINGEPMTIRTFASHGLFEQHFPAFLKTMSLEALLARQRDEAAGRGIQREKARVDLVRDLVDEIGRSSGARGGYAACVYTPPRGSRRVVTEDWTASAEVGGEARRKLEALHALGYTR